MKNYIVDTSVIIEKVVSKLIKEKKVKGKVLVPHAVVSELENQANRGKEIGFLGLEELQELQKMKGAEIELEFIGHRPNEFQISRAKSGEIDAYIRELAQEHNAVLITGDKVQAESGKAFGLEVFYFELRHVKEKLQIESFFDEQTMSLHLKEKCIPVGKKGKPGAWDLVALSDKKVTGAEIEEMAKEAVEKSRIDPESFVEISRQGSTIIQYHEYRIVVVRPPVSDGWEMTVVRPIKKLNLGEYELPPQVSDRIEKQARGMVIAGETGSGKSTFAQAIGEFFAGKKRIVKTIESPRDLQLRDEITQYSKNFASEEEMHDILFLSRPDNLIFDEMRDTPDFKLYTDLRLAGSNAIGVLHAAAPIDAVQRFIGRVDSGMIPSVVDTIIFMEAGKIKKILALKMLVKVPTGMTESDLARPVVEVRDFLTNKLEFEIYSYGEETVVIPVEGTAAVRGVKKLAAREIERFFAKNYGDCQVEILSDAKAAVSVPEEMIARIIGKQGANIQEIEDALGISLEIRELTRDRKSAHAEIKEDKKHIVLYTQPGAQVEVYANDQFVLSAYASKNGEIKVHKKSNVGRVLLQAMSRKQKIDVRV